MPTSPILDSNECIPMSVVNHDVQRGGFYDESVEHGGEIPKDAGDFTGDLKKTISIRGRTRKWKNVFTCKCICIAIILANLVALDILAGFCFKKYTSQTVKDKTVSIGGAITSRIGDITTTMADQSQSTQNHVLSVNLDKQRRNTGGDFIWTCPAESRRNGFGCDGTSFVVPTDGWYSLHMQVTMDTTLALHPIYKTLIVRDCIMKKDAKLSRNEEIIRCNRMKIPVPAGSIWAGHSEITVLRQYLQKGQIIKAVTKTSAELLHGNPNENVFEITLVR